MKKFKVKNRQKRKYTKKAPTPIQTVPFFHPTLSHVFPFFILTFGLVITIVVSIPMNQLEHFHITTPSFSIHDMQYAIGHFKGVSVSTISLPSLSFPKTHIETITKPMGQSIKQTSSNVSMISQSVYTFLQILFSLIWKGEVLIAQSIKGSLMISINALRITLHLSLQLMSFLGGYTLISLNLAHRSILTSVIRIFYAYQLGFELCKQFVQIIWKGITILTNLIFSVIKIYVANLLYRTLSLIMWCSAMLTRLFTAVFTSISISIQTIIGWLSALGKLIAQPFIYLYKQIMKLKPASDFITENITQASGVLGQGTKNIIELPETFKK